jgi:hypothetical protein
MMIKREIPWIRGSGSVPGKFLVEVQISAFSSSSQSATNGEIVV